MSGHQSSSVEAPRRVLSPRQADTVDRLTSAAVEEVRAAGYDGLTVRNVARRAGVAPATAYTYFTSKDHLLTEVFWRRLGTLPADPADAGDGPTDHLAAVMAALVLVVSDEPELAAACTTALLAPDPEVRLLRARIGAEVHRRLAEALGPRRSPARLDALEFVVTGALVQAGMGHVGYDELPSRLAAVAHLLQEGPP